MTKSIVKEKLKSGERVLCVTVGIHHPVLAELAGMMGFDCVWLDFQHHATNLETAASLIRACRAAGIEAMARPGMRAFEDMRRYLELGASGILYPQAETIEEFRELVLRAKFPPEGRRGFGGGTFDAGYSVLLGDPGYTSWRNRETFILAQLESKKAVEIADQVAAISGIDGLFVGAADLALDLGLAPGTKDPALDRCIDIVADAARAGGKAWGMPVGSPDHAKAMLAKGATFLCTGSDLVSVRNAWGRLRQDFGNLGFKFRPPLRLPREDAD